MDLSVSNSEACAVAADGSLHCWGNPWWNFQDEPDGVFVAVSAGGETACALRDDGQVVCWGKFVRPALD